MTIRRRTFLASVSVSAGAAAVWSGLSADDSALQWCGRPVHPLCEKVLHVRDFEAGQAELCLRYLAPGVEAPEEVEVIPVVLQGGREMLAFRLPNVHLSYRAGVHEFVAVVRQGDRELVSPSLSYRLRPFSFGA